jgi:hypothetical protein
MKYSRPKVKQFDFAISRIWNFRQYIAATGLTSLESLGCQSWR